MNETIAFTEQELVSTLLPEALVTQYSAGAISKLNLAPYVSAIQQISARYTTERKKFSLKSELEAASYALYFGQISAAKFLHLFEVTGLQKTALNSVLDFGSGTGGALLALEQYGIVSEQIHAIETNKAMRGILKKLISKITIEESIVANRCYDLILAGNVLNELSEKELIPTVEKLLAALPENGKLYCIEPALIETTHRLQAVRDFVAPQYHILFPCTHNNPCPMRKTDPENWCHFELGWNPPKLIKQLDALSGFNKHRIKYSALVIQKTLPVSREEKLVRILTDPTKKHGTYKALLCGDGVYGEAEVPKRAKAGMTDRIQ